MSNYGWLLGAEATIASAWLVALNDGCTPQPASVMFSGLGLDDCLQRMNNMEWIWGEGYNPNWYMNYPRRRDGNVTVLCGMIWDY
jgi:hypothetical protein